MQELGSLERRNPSFSLEDVDMSEVGGVIHGYC